MKAFKEVLRRNRTAILVFAAMTAGNAVVFGLYRGVFYVLTHQEELLQKLLPY